MLSFTKNRDQPQNRQVCLTTPLVAPFVDQTTHLAEKGVEWGIGFM